jgi:hypothetical protein
MKMFSLGLALIVQAFGCSAAFALSPADILAQKDVYSAEVLAKPEFALVVRNTLANDLTAKTSISTPAKIADGRFLVLTGCEAEACNENSATVIIDSKNPRAVMVIRYQMLDKSAQTKNPQAIYIRNKTWTATVNEDKFPELAQAINPY